MKKKTKKSLYFSPHTNKLPGAVAQTKTRKLGITGLLYCLYSFLFFTRGCINRGTPVITATHNRKKRFAEPRPILPSSQLCKIKLKHGSKIRLERLSPPLHQAFAVAQT